MKTIEQIKEETLREFEIQERYASGLNRGKKRNKMTHLTPKKKKRKK